VMICFIIVAGFGGKHFINLPMGSGSLEAANFLSMGTAIIGYQVAWMPIAADYGVYMRENIKPITTFSWMYAGLVSCQILVELLGAALGTLALSSNTLFSDAYDSRGIGGLIGAVFETHGSGAHNFGKFIELLLAFSTVGVIITNIYSLGLSVQMVSNKLMIIPRLIWSLIGGVIFLVCSMAGREHLETVMENFLLICAYWIVPFGTILLAEHYIWRRGFQYDLSAIDDAKKLPWGIAASVAFVLGTVLALLCMSQTWWVGPIAKGVGGSPYGTDISWELALPFTLGIYIPLRMWERKKWDL
jgi:purine-cytosine permease-like protein